MPQKFHSSFITSGIANSFQKSNFLSEKFFQIKDSLKVSVRVNKTTIAIHSLWMQKCWQQTGFIPLSSLDHFADHTDREIILPGTLYAKHKGLPQQSNPPTVD